MSRHLIRFNIQVKHVHKCFVESKSIPANIKFNFIIAQVSRKSDEEWRVLALSTHFLAGEARGVVIGLHLNHHKGTKKESIHQLKGVNPR